MVRSPGLMPGMAAATRSSLDNIARLRQLVARLVALEDEAASWLANGAAIYERIGRRTARARYHQ
jgi:hypothetical protein